MLTFITLYKNERWADNCPLVCRQTTARITMLPAPMLVLAASTPALPGCQYRCLCLLQVRQLYFVASMGAFACCEYATFTWLPAQMLVLAAITPALSGVQHRCLCLMQVCQHYLVSSTDACACCLTRCTKLTVDSHHTPLSIRRHQCRSHPTSQQ